MGLSCLPLCRVALYPPAHAPNWQICLPFGFFINSYTECLCAMPVAVSRGEAEIYGVFR